MNMRDSALYDAINFVGYAQWFFVAYFVVAYFTCKHLTKKETIALFFWIEVAINFPYVKALLTAEVEPYVSAVIAYVLLINISIGGIGTLLLMKVIKKKGV